MIKKVSYKALVEELGRPTSATTPRRTKY